MSNLWIFTPDGFYSSRKDEYCEDDEVMIRARAYEDLLALADVVGMENPEIIRIPKADYLYRMKVKQQDWNVYCAHAAMNHTPYGGIKDTDDMDRYLTYLRIWELMCQLQNLKDAEKRGNKTDEEHERDKLMDMVWPDVSLYHSKYRDKAFEYIDGQEPRRIERRKKKKKKKKKRNYAGKIVNQHNIVYLDEEMREFDTTRRKDW